MSSSPATATAAATAAAVVALASLAAGCSQNSQMGEASAVATDSITGTVRQVGSTPFTRIVVEGEEGSVRITGELEGEIAALVGARVRVAGTPPEGEEPGRTLEAVGYEVLSVDGRTPAVGVLRHRAGEGYRLETEDGGSVPLRGVPDLLGGKVGAKVWILLGDGGSVQRYGILREPEGTGT